MLTFSEGSEVVADGYDAIAKKHIAVAERLLSEWEEGKDPNYLIAYERMAERAQLAAGKSATWEKFAAGEVFK